MFAAPFSDGFRLASPDEVIELDHENRLLREKLAQALDMVDGDPARLLAAAFHWLADERPGDQTWPPWGAPDETDPRLANSLLAAAAAP